MADIQYEHPYLDLVLIVDHADMSACLVFGQDMPFDEIPMDGECIVLGRHYWSVGEMDSSEPPILYHHIGTPPHVWWEVEDEEADLV